MREDREQRGPAVAPDEPSAPAAGEEPSRAAEAVPSEELSEDERASVADEEQEEPREHERQLERDIEELTAKAEKADEYLELARRTKADFENYRKRAAREAASAQERGIAKLANELLPAVDDLDRALTAAESAGNGEDDLVSGIKLVHGGVIAALARVGIEPFSPKGERFDPERHEAMAQEAVEGTEPGTIVEVYQRGYRFGNDVLRPAKVVVAG